MEKSSPSLRDECQAYIAILAGPRQTKDSRETWIAKAARPGLSERMVRKLFYGEITDPEHPAVETLRGAAEDYELASIAQQIDELSRRLRTIAAKRSAAHERGRLPQDVLDIGRARRLRDRDPHRSRSVVSGEVPAPQPASPARAGRTG